LDASGGGVFRNLIRPAKGALIRAAASTQPLGIFTYLRDIGGDVPDKVSFAVN